MSEYTQLLEKYNEIRESLRNYAKLEGEMLLKLVPIVHESGNSEDIELLNDLLLNSTIDKLVKKGSLAEIYDIRKKVSNLIVKYLGT